MNLRSHLQRIYDERGDLTPPLVVDAARDPEHPLHHRFEWDDTQAAESWRREQAAHLIRSVRIVYAEDSDGPKRVRGFVAVRAEGSHHASYQPTPDALADEFTRRIVLAAMEREWRTLYRRYGHMQEFAHLIAATTSKEEAS